LEQSSPVDRSSYTAAFNPASSLGTTTGAPSSFIAQMQDVLGAHAEPDPLFFVDSWTIGLEAATENLQARQHTTQNTTAFRAFDFSVPLVFIEESSAAFSAGMPLGFREAYGVSAKSPHSEASRPQKSAMPVGEPEPVPEPPPFNIPDPNRPLTLQRACCLLGVASTSSREQIKTAYRQLVRRYHPDHIACSSNDEQRFATDRMITINQAYHLLCDSRVAAS
jgi:hypothetical protein